MRQDKYYELHSGNQNVINILNPAEINEVFITDEIFTFEQWFSHEVQYHLNITLKTDMKLDYT